MRNKKEKNTIDVSENTNYEKLEGNNIKKKGWEILNEEKEMILNIIKEKPEILDKQVLIPELMYPNLQKYEVRDATNNLILSVTSIKNNYPDNVWIMADTINICKYIDENGEKKPVFLLKKGEKATKIGIRKLEISVKDEITGEYHKEKLDKSYIKNVNVYNISQFCFAKGFYPKKTYIENKKKAYVLLEKETIDKLNKNKFENKIEKFFIEQRYNIKNKNEIFEINEEELVYDIENKKSYTGNFLRDSYKMEYFPSKAKHEMENDLKDVEVIIK